MTTTPNDTKRLNYFTGEFLQDKDFTAEQTYHLEMRRRHNKSCHVFGVASGLTVTKLTDHDVQVSDGMAIDKDGREIVVRVPTTFTVKGTTPNVYLTISYSELKDGDDLRSEGGANDFVRLTERPVLNESADPPPTDGAVILLARIALKPDVAHTIDTIDVSGVPRAAASAVAPGSVGEAQLAPNSVTAPKLNLAAGSVSGTVLTDNTVAAGKLNLATGSINGTVLATNSVTADKLATSIAVLGLTPPVDVTFANLGGGQTRTLPGVAATGITGSVPLCLFAAVTALSPAGNELFVQQVFFSVLPDQGSGNRTVNFNVVVKNNGTTAIGGTVTVRALVVTNS